MSGLIYRMLAMVLTIAGILPTAITAQTSGLHNFGTYNVRYTNDVSDETERSWGWEQRRDYVIQIINDYDFDVLGMQEVTGLGCKYGSTTGISQLNDLRNRLDSYELLPFERDGNGNAKDYSYNVIAYKKDKYELIESGCFWLSPTPDFPSVGWDPEYTIKRTCAWAKLQVKTSGEVFYFAVAHCNYGLSKDGASGGQLVSERLQSIAGEVPLILVGDFNMRREEHSDAYREYVRNMDDAAMKADVSKCLPEENGQIEWTTTGWTPANKATSGSEFDYGFYRNMHVYERYVITENYGNQYNPSDHYPILMRTALTPGKRILYVDGNVSITGDGSMSLPYSKIGEALEVAAVGEEIRVAEGVYRESLDMKTSVVLRGGYDSSFQSVVGSSVVDGDLNGDDGGNNFADNLSNLVRSQYASVDMRGFVVRNSKSKNRDTDGAIVTGGAELHLQDMEICNNYSVAGGGGILSKSRSVDLSDCVFKGNFSEETGGGMLVRASSDVMINRCLFESNEAKSGAAVTLLGCPRFQMTNSTVHRNKGGYYGAVYFYSNNVKVSYGPFEFEPSYPFGNSTAVNCTFANNELTSPTGLATKTKKYGGSALYASFPDSQSALNVAHCTFTGNTSLFVGDLKGNYGGSSVRVYGGSVTLMNNIIAGNNGEGAYVDFYVDDSSILKKESYNVVSTTSSANVELSSTDFVAPSWKECVESLQFTLDGTISDGRFVASLADCGGSIPLVGLRSPIYCGQRIDVLTAFKRYVETACQVDLDGDGSIGGALRYDQRGENRSERSVPGACESLLSDGINEQFSETDTLDIYAAPGSIFISDCRGFSLGMVSVVSLDGRLIFSEVVNDSEYAISCGDFIEGVYIISVGGFRKKILIRK